VPVAAYGHNVEYHYLYAVGNIVESLSFTVMRDYFNCSVPVSGGI
jgi:hypothetical protein